MSFPKSIFAICIAAFFLFACNDAGSKKIKENQNTALLKEQEVTYKLDTVTMTGFMVYDDHFKGKRPGVLVVHEWWGQTDYPRKRARQLAEMGYIAMAVDMYGNRKIAADPKEAQALATPFYMNVQMIKDRLDAAENKLKEMEQTDPGKIAAIGYCYGGFVVLNAAKLGADLKGVASFHGNLTGAPADKNKTKANILVLHGAADQFVTQQEVDGFKKSMDSAGIQYSFKAYPGATHSFTNPDATALGKKFNMPIAYNAEADKNSWEDLKQFLATVFK